MLLGILKFPLVKNLPILFPRSFHFKCTISRDNILKGKKIIEKLNVQIIAYVTLFTLSKTSTHCLPVSISIVAATDTNKFVIPSL